MLVELVKVAPTVGFLVSIFILLFFFDYSHNYRQRTLGNHNINCETWRKAQLEICGFPLPITSLILFTFQRNLALTFRRKRFPCALKKSFIKLYFWSNYTLPGGRKFPFNMHSNALLNTGNIAILLCWYFRFLLVFYLWNLRLFPVSRFNKIVIKVVLSNIFRVCLSLLNCSGINISFVCSFLLKFCYHRSPIFATVQHSANL